MLPKRPHHFALPAAVHENSGLGQSEGETGHSTFCAGKRRPRQDCGSPGYRLPGLSTKVSEWGGKLGWLGKWLTLLSTR